MPELDIPTCIGSFDLRARPELITELRENPGAHSERRVVPSTIEIRAEAEGEGFEMEGHAAVFDELSDNLGGFREIIDRGAFRKVLNTSPDVWALFNHNPDQVLARTVSKTLTLKEDTKGLRYRAEVGPTTHGEDLRIMLERGDVTQSSFAFRVGEDEWEEDEESGALIRRIHEFSALYDVSPCIYPAYPQTDAGLRSNEAIDKLARGEDLTADERAELQALLDDSRTSTEEDDAQRAARADDQEPGEQGAESEDRSEGEGPQAQAGISPAAVRLRVRERISARAR